mmetsp:Transcript_56749/g.182266  ORF Transcript_56749/g.182266 Transcript_56749/m.182266 type:complete len:84 (+) Transcript_56749:342-593(+)
MGQLRLDQKPSRGAEAGTWAGRAARHSTRPWPAVCRMGNQAPQRRPVLSLLRDLGPLQLRQGLLAKPHISRREGPLGATASPR